MSDGRRRAGFLTNRAVVLLTTALVAIGLTGLSTAAIAATGGGGGGGNGGGNGNGGKKHHHKKKKCPKGTHKVISFKHGKRKKKCVADPVIPTTPAPAGTPAALVITPPTHDFGSSPHGNGTCSGCPTQAYTVTNVGGSTSGALTASFTEVKAHSPSNNDAFTITQNGCTAALAAGASCSLTVRFHPPNNNGDEEWISNLDVVGAPGGDAQAQLSGIAS